MDESRIPHQLNAIAAEMAAGQSRERIFDSILEAIQEMGFDRVRLDLISPDRLSVSPAAMRGFNGREPGGAIPVSEDLDLVQHSSDSRPRVTGTSGCEVDGNGHGERGIVPLVQRGLTIGKLTVDNPVSGRLISHADLEKVVPFAHQATIAQALLWARSLEVLQGTTLAITSMGDRHLLLNRIVEQAVKLLGAKSGGIYEYRPELGELTVIEDFSRPSEYVGQKTLQIGEGMAGKVIQDRLPYLSVPDYSQWHGKAKIYETGRFGAVLEVPLLWKERYIGVLYVDDDTGRVFSDIEIHLLQLFAERAAISLINSNLLRGEEKKLQRLERLAAATREMMGNLDGMSLEDRLLLIARHTVEILKAETAGVFRAQEGEIVLEASYGHQGDFEPGKLKLRIHDEPQGGLTGYIAFHGDLFQAKGEELALHPAAKGSPTHVPSGPCYSLIAIPLKKRTVAGEKLIGLIRADNKQDEESGRVLPTLEFTTEDASMFRIFAEAAIVAIESAELVDRLKEQKEFQETLIESAPDGIIAIDRKGLITEFNKRAEEILGFANEEVIGTSVFPLYVDPQEPYRIGELLRAADDKRLRDYETAFRSKDGEHIPILHASTWLFDLKGQRVGSVGFFSDLRSRKALERRASLLLRASNVVAQAASLDVGLQSLTEMMVSLLGRSFCCILIMDEDGNFLTLRAWSRSGEPRWNPGQPRIMLSEWPGLKELLEDGSPALRDWSDERVRPNLERLSNTLGLAEDIESLLVVPLRIGSRVVGQLDLGNLGRSTRATFPPQEIELVAAIASQVTIFIDRMAMLEKRNRGEALLRALVDSSIHIRGEMEMPKLLQGVVRLAAELVGCQIGGLFLNRPYLRRLDLVAVHGLPEDLVNRSLSHEDGVIGQVAREGETIVQIGSQPEELFNDLRLKTIAAAPLREASGEIAGVLFVGALTVPLELGRTDREVLEAFATQAAIALRTSNLMGQEQSFFSQLAILHRISDYIQEADELEKILLTVLTGVTANFGLGFNRAVLLRVDETGEQLVGEMGIGELEDHKARSAWKVVTTAGLNDFERFRQRLEAGEIKPASTTVGKKTLGLRLSARGGDLFSEVVSSRKFREIGVEELNRVPREFRDRFRVTTPIAVAPLVAKGQVIGILAVDNKFTLAPFSPESSKALMTFAATAAVAIANKRLWDQTRNDAENLVSFYKMNTELISLPDSRLILRKIVDQTVAAAKAAFVSLVLINESGSAFNPIISGRSFSLNPREPFPIRRNGFSMQVMRTGDAFIIENVENVREQINRELMEPSVQAAICLPLSLPGRRIGVMWIHYTDARHFPKSEVAALQLYVNQAAVAYDSAIQIERLDEIRRATDALAEVDDARSVLQRVVDGARRLLTADAVVFWFYDSKTDAFIPESSAYSGQNVAAWTELQTNSPLKEGTASRIMARDWIHIADVQNLEQAAMMDPNTTRFLTEIGARGFQGVALIAGKEKLGVLYAIYSKPRSFDDSERSTALAFANRAAFELKKAKLLQQVQRARQAAEVLARVTLLEDHETVLDSAAKEIREALACGIVVIYKFDEESGTLVHPPAMAGLSPTEGAPSSGGFVLAMLERDTPYIVPEITRDEEFRGSTFAKAYGIKSCVVTPLRAGNRKVGVMFISYRNPRRFTADELTNIKLFANQAAVAIRNAQLFDKVALKLSQQEALAGLSRMLLDANSVQETMGRSVKFAAEALHTQFCSIVHPDRDGNLLFSAAVGWESSMVGTFVLEPGDGSQTGYTIKTGMPISVFDYSKLTDFRVPDIVFSHKIHSGLSAPMFREREIVGAMLVHTQEERRFDDDDKTLLSLIANQTAIALERAQQHEGGMRKSAYLEALYKASKAITEQVALERRQILEQIVQPTMKSIIGAQGPKAQLGTIYLYDAVKDDLVLESAYPPDQYDHLVKRLGERWPVHGHPRSDVRIGITGRAFTTGEPQLIRDVQLSNDYVMGNSDTRSELAVPLLDHDEIIGVLNVESDTLGAFDLEDQTALQGLAELVVVAIQKNRQIEELKAAKQMISTQTTLAWMGIGNVVGRHEMARFKGVLLAEIYLLKHEFEKVGFSDRRILQRLAGIKRSIERELGVNEQPIGSVGKDLSAIVVNDLVRRRKGSIKHKRGDGALRLEIKCELSDATRVRGNRHWLDQVLDILVNNAVDATADLARRKLVIGSRNRGGMAEIYVSDNGPGIPVGVRGKLLREPIGKPAGAKGLGIGLLIAQAIVQVYGGLIYWEDGSPQGTTVVISLPIEEAVRSSPGQSVSEGVDDRGKGKAR